MGYGPGGAGRQRDHRADRRPGRLYADSGAIPRRARPQPLRQPRPAQTASSSLLLTTRPSDGGFKYNPPEGGPAPTDVTAAIQDRANALLSARLTRVRRTTIGSARTASTTQRYDFLGSYVGDLSSVIDLAAIKEAAIRIGADPLGGASVNYWGAIGDRYGLDLTVVNTMVDPTWRFMTLDWDGKIRTDCSSPYAMASLIERKDEFQIATGNDADADRFGVVTPDGGLMPPNHFLVGGHRVPVHPSAGLAAGRVRRQDARVVQHGRPGRRWPRAVTCTRYPSASSGSSTGLIDGTVGFGGEESAGASFLRRDGQVWTTDKDGILLCLLASEILATTGKSPSERYRALTERFGDPAYARVDAPATREEKAALAQLRPEDVTATELAGEPITAKLTTAPGNGAPIGGLKVVTESGWFAARPSGTEDVYKIYAESFKGPDHLAQVQDEARLVVGAALSGARAGAH